MTRKKLWFCNTCLMFGFVGMLLLTAPGLAAAPIGFAVTYIPAIGLAFLLSIWIGRAATCFVACFWFFLGYGFAGAPEAVIFAMVLTIGNFLLIARKRPAATVETPRAEVMAIDHAARLGS